MLISTVAEVKRQGKEWRNLRLYGQELNYGTSAIARMNLFLHGVTDGHIAHGIRCRSRHSMMDPDACRRCGFCSLWLNAEHQEFTNLIWNGLRTCAKTAMTADPEQCWRVSTETNVFFGRTGMSDFVTPDFMVYKCLPEPHQYVRSDRVVLVGEVLSPSNSDADMEAKKARYARAGIPWYWEVTLATHRSEIAHIHAYTLIPEVKPPDPGITVLHRANYVLAGTWSPTDAGAVTINHPFPISVPWSDLEF